MCAMMRTSPGKLYQTQHVWYHLDRLNAGSVPKKTDCLYLLRVLRNWWKRVFRSLSLIKICWQYWKNWRQIEARKAFLGNLTSNYYSLEQWVNNIFDVNNLNTQKCYLNKNDVKVAVKRAPPRLAEYLYIYKRGACVCAELWPSTPPGSLNPAPQI